MRSDRVREGHLCDERLRIHGAFAPLRPLLEHRPRPVNGRLSLGLDHAFPTGSHRIRATLGGKVTHVLLEPPRVQIWIRQQEFVNFGEDLGCGCGCGRGRGWG